MDGGVMAGASIDATPDIVELGVGVVACDIAAEAADAADPD
jgi:hypothetical protein